MLRKVWEELCGEKMARRTALALWCFVVGGAALWLLNGSVAYWVQHGMLPPDTSGWVQAIGGLLAVAVAIAVPWWMKGREIAQAAAADKQKRFENADALLAVVEHQAEVFGYAQRYLSRVTPSPSVYHNPLEHHHREAGRLLEMHSREVEQIHLQNFGAELVRDVLACKAAAAFAAHLAKVIESPPLQYSQWQADMSRLDVLAKTVAENESRLAARCQQLKDGLSN